MTLREKQKAMLLDLIGERVIAEEVGTIEWMHRLDTKISELQEAMEQ
jgi:hypothetical protein